MHILCPTFGYYVKLEKIQPKFYASNVNITQFYFTFKKILSQCQKKIKMKVLHIMDQSCCGGTSMTMDLDFAIPS
jgi:hypothetical protein